MSIKNSAHFRHLWIGLVQVKPKPGNYVLGSAIGAYAQMVCVAETREEYIRRVQQYLESADFEFCNIEDVERLSDRMVKHDPDKELLLSIAEMDPDSVVLDTLHSYENADLHSGCLAFPQQYGHFR